MRFTVICRYIGFVLLINAGFMLLSALVSLYYDFDSGFYPLAMSSVLTGVLGAFPMIFVPKATDVTIRENYMILICAWILVCVAGMFPYMLWGGEFSPSTAWFESVSGYSATGASALPDVEALPRGLLFWRSMTHLMGGAGVVIFALLILPTIGRSKASLSSGEISVLAKDNFRYSSRKIVKLLLFVYVGMIAAQIILLCLAGMPLFDSVNMSVSTVATGGFCIHNTGVAYYDSALIEMIVALFLTLGGLHFGLIFGTITGRGKNIFTSEISRYYLISIGVVIVIMTFFLTYSGSYPFWTSLRHSAFHVPSFMSSTAFTTANVSTWGAVPILLIIFMTIQCGCAGSTSGGMKADRIFLAMKAARVGFLQKRHPNAVIRIRIDRMVQDDPIVSAVLLYFFIYLSIMFVGAVVLAASGLDLATAFSSSLASVGNIGSGFGEIGPGHSFAGFSPFAKFVCTAMMLLGRLEIFGLLHLFSFKW